MAAAADIDPAAAERALAELRHDIDAIDDAMHDLLMKRADLVDRIATAKGRDNGRDAGPLFRPGREASILRRLVARHRPPLPAEVVVRLWREIVTALTRLQGPFAVAAFAPAGATRYVDLARDHFGGSTPVQAVPSVASALAALERGRVQVAVLPLPEDTDRAAEAWWRGLGGGLASRRPASPIHILARLPFLAAGSRAAKSDGLVVGRQPFDPSGGDRGYLAVETESETSRARLRAGLEAAGLAPAGFPADAEERVARGRALQIQLVETAAWIPADDPRLRRAAAALGNAVGIRSLGGYAEPLPSPAAKRK